MDNTSTLEASCSPGPSPRPIRLIHPFPTRFQIQAYPKCRTKNTVIHITTASPAVVTYVLGPDWEEGLGKDNLIRYSGISDDWTETDEESLAQRIIKMGGAVIDISAIDRDYPFDSSAEQFAAFSRAQKFLFGWPDTGGVWVLHLHGSVPYEFWKKPRIKVWENGGVTAEAARELEEEEASYGQPFSLPPGAIDTRSLNKARTISEYCKELEILGAVHYNDPMDSHEVREASVFERGILTRQWSGFEAWKTAEDQEIEEELRGQAEFIAAFEASSDKSSSVYDRCILI